MIATNLDVLAAIDDLNAGTMSGLESLTTKEEQVNIVVSYLANRGYEVDVALVEELLRYLPHAQRPALPAADRIVAVVPCDEQLNCLVIGMSPARVVSWAITASGNVRAVVMNPDENRMEVITDVEHPRFEPRVTGPRVKHTKPSPNGRRLLPGTKR